MAFATGLLLSGRCPPPADSARRLPQPQPTPWRPASPPTLATPAPPLRATHHDPPPFPARSRSLPPHDAPARLIAGRRLVACGRESGESRIRIGDTAFAVQPIPAGAKPRQPFCSPLAWRRPRRPYVGRVDIRVVAGGRVAHQQAAADLRLNDPEVAELPLGTEHLGTVGIEAGQLCRLSR